MRRGIVVALLATAIAGVTGLAQLVPPSSNSHIPPSVGELITSIVDSDLSPAVKDELLRRLIPGLSGLDIFPSGSDSPYGPVPSVVPGPIGPDPIPALITITIPTSLIPTPHASALASSISNLVGPLVSVVIGSADPSSTSTSTSTPKPHYGADFPPPPARAPPPPPGPSSFVPLFKQNQFGRAPGAGQVGYYHGRNDSFSSVAPSLIESCSYDNITAVSLLSVRFGTPPTGLSTQYPVQISVAGPPLCVARSGSDQADVPARFGLVPNCFTLGSQVVWCQDQGKKIYLAVDASASGMNGTYFSSARDPEPFADALWDLFGGGVGAIVVGGNGSSTTAPTGGYGRVRGSARTPIRPFGAAPVVDGFEIFVPAVYDSSYRAEANPPIIDSSAAGLVTSPFFGTFLDRIKTHFEKVDDVKEWFLTVSLPCPVPGEGNVTTTDPWWTRFMGPAVWAGLHTGGIDRWYFRGNCWANAFIDRSKG